jgi:NADH dehydrogenase
MTKPSAAKSVITILGGNGFIGSYIVKELAKTKAAINVVGRHASSATHLKMYGSVGQICLTNADVTDLAQLENLIASSDIVINTIGLLAEKGKQTFEKIHVQLPANIAKLVNKYKTKHFVHISSLAAEQAPTSKYAQTKLAGEKEISKYCSNYTILRPSVVFGAEDNFFNLFAKLSAMLPALPLIGGGLTKMQPVFVNDVALSVAAIINEPFKHAGLIYELGGANQYTFKQLMEFILKTLDRKRLLIPLPYSLAMLQAFCMEFLPKPLLTRDQVELLKYNNIVTKENGLTKLNLVPANMELIVSEYLR